MSGETQSFLFERTVAAPAAAVYRAFTSSTALREWFCDAAQAEAKPGGRLYTWWHDGYYMSSEFSRLEPGKSIAYTWSGRGEPGPSQVEISLREADGSTAATVIHSGVGTGDAWAGTVQAIQQGWDYALENLQSVLETGQDLRFVRRPMLGIYVGEFDEKIAAELGVPVKEGIRLDDTLEGMGARAAGLQKDDVIVSMAGKPITDWPSLTAALQSARAGDDVEVVYFRQGEKQQATMTLSGRPLPDIPATAGELAQAVSNIFTEIEAALGQALANVSDAEASHRPAEGEWSARETLAHLIASEQESQAWIADLINDSERWSETFANATNVPARIQGLMTAYPAVPDLLQALKCSQATTVAMLANLPDSFVARKSSYWRVAYNMLEGTPHLHTHLAQVQAAIEAARAS